MFNRTAIALAFAVVATPALAVDLPPICTANAPNAAMEPMKQGSMNMGGQAAPAMDAEHSDLMAGMDKMNADMMAGASATDIDVAFACAMIPHHQGAIDMAKAELAHGDDPQMRQLATDIIAAQEKEISAMMDWLAKQK